MKVASVLESLGFSHSLGLSNPVEIKEFLGLVKLVEDALNVPLDIAFKDSSSCDRGSSVLSGQRFWSSDIVPFSCQPWAGHSNQMLHCPFNFDEGSVVEKIGKMYPND
ncbi:hypothetical protein [Halomicronema sp. CCY15110]|uniref:hypothetical protein n=1 Tax=Halomicronema sp. CCY15110 TaxID=2767773 RepID=UPI0019506C71|nr:hypothetical protein [Halomicronema sp. CCY15110]